jgi:hypothetical protein
MGHLSVFPRSSESFRFPGSVDMNVPWTVGLLEEVSVLTSSFRSAGAASELM